MQFTVWKAGRNLEETRAISSKDRQNMDRGMKKVKKKKKTKKKKKKQEAMMMMTLIHKIVDQYQTMMLVMVVALHQVQTLRDGTMKAENELDMVTENRIDKMG